MNPDRQKAWCVAAALLLDTPAEDLVLTVVDRLVDALERCERLERELLRVAAQHAIIPVEPTILLGRVVRKETDHA